MSKRKRPSRKTATRQAPTTPNASPVAAPEVPASPAVVLVRDCDRPVSR